MAPSNSADEQLALDIVKFLAILVKGCEGGTRSDKDSSTMNDTLGWIGEMLLSSGGALYHLLTKTDLSFDGSDGRLSTTQASRYHRFTTDL